MSIVILTVPEEARRIFANELHQATGGAVRLVIIQKGLKRNNSLFHQIKKFYESGGLMSLLAELWHAISLRLSPKSRRALNYFRERDLAETSEKSFLPETIVVGSHNSEETLKILREISPDLLVIWSNTVVSEEILATAKEAVNLHMGLCPYYRGSVANQYALLSEPERIGTTVHHVERGVDTGDVIETITIDLSKPPREAFRDLNKRAEKLFLDIARKLHEGAKLERHLQDKSIGKNFMLKDWTPKVRVRVAKAILNWEKRGALTK